ncbi:MAG TPA: acyl carrier protein [Polyangiaceae bacterium]|nr:acyl carrier protein [Polyangiaceae bacterium]
MIEDIREILQQHARLGVDANSLSPDSDLYDAGLTSHATVNLMLALEDRFQVEFPDELMDRGSFASISSIRSAIEQIRSRAISA